MIKEGLLTSLVMIAALSTPAAATTPSRPHYVVLGEEETSETLPVEELYSFESKIYEDHYFEGYEAGSVKFNVYRDIVSQVEEEVLVSEATVDEEGNEIPAVYETQTKDVVTTISVTEGYQKGDTVEMIVSPSMFYTVGEVKVTNNSLSVATTHADSSTVWKFTLDTYGTYSAEVNFVASESLTQIMDIYTDASAGKWEDVFSVQNIMFMVESLAVVIYFMYNILTNKKSLAKLGSDIASKLGLDASKSIEDNITSMKGVLEDEIAQYKKIAESSEASAELTRDAMKKFVQAFLYMQDNTPESKQCIIDLLSNLGLSSDADTQNIVNAVIAKLEEQQAEKDAEQKATEETLESLKETLNEAVPTEETVTTEEDKSDTAEGRV